MNNNLFKMLVEDLKDSYQIYCDLDGVLCDFEGRFEHFTGINPQEYKANANYQYGEQKGLEKFWDVIDNQVGMRFWRGMSFIPQGRILWDYIKQYNPIILTAPSRDISSREGKELWVQDNLGDFQVNFRSAQKKSDFAEPTSILIDDRQDTINSWKSQNGIGLLFNNNSEDIIRELNKIGL